MWKSKTWLIVDLTAASFALVYLIYEMVKEEKEWHKLEKEARSYKTESSKT